MRDERDVRRKIEMFAEGLAQQCGVDPERVHVQRTVQLLNLGIAIPAARNSSTPSAASGWQPCGGFGSDLAAERNPGRGDHQADYTLAGLRSARLTGPAMTPGTAPATSG